MLINKQRLKRKLWKNKKVIDIASVVTLATIPFLANFFGWKIFAIVASPFCFFPLYISLYSVWFEKSTGRIFDHKAGQGFGLFFMIPLMYITWILGFLLIEWPNSS
jgi:hypothetical protein